MRTSLVNAVKHRSTLVMAGLIVVASLALAACGGSPTATPTQTPTATAAATQNTPTPTPTEAMMEATATPTPAPVSFSGKTIRITVGYAPGGGFDTFARILATFLHSDLPGNPTVIVTNLPGANTLTAYKAVMDSKPNGSTIEMALIDSNLIVSSVLGLVDGVDINAPVYLGKADSVPGTFVLCARTSVVPDLATFNAATTPYTVGGTAGTGSYDLTTKWMEASGLPVTPLLGYGGTSEIVAAFNRGEIDMTLTCTDPQVEQNPQWITDNYMTPLMYFEAEPQWLIDGQKQGKWANVKQVYDLYPNLTTPEKQAFDTFHQLAAGSRLFLLPPNTPQDITNALLQGFKDVVGSPDFVSAMNNRGYDVGLLPGATFQKSVKDASTLPADALNILKTMYRPGS